MGSGRSPQSASPLVRIQNLSKSFGGVMAVDHVTLDIYEGEFFCLLGPSGCGKSTLLRMLAGFTTPTSGGIEIDGEKQRGIPPYQRPTNMMFQSYALFPHMTVAHNIGYGLRREGIARREIKRRVAEMVELVQLGNLTDRKPHQLSGGQRQRVALARALIKRPKVLLLDEPLAALDKKLREQTQFELMRIQKSLGMTFIVVTHDQEEAMVLANRIGVMRDGHIIQIGEPHDVYEYPNCRYVAEFIGTVNVFEGEVVDAAADHLCLRSPDAGCEIRIDHGAEIAPHQSLLVAIRPEKFTLKPGQSTNIEANTTGGTVGEVAYMGNLSVFDIVLDTGKRVLASQPNLARRSEAQLATGDPVTLRWQPSAGVVLTS